MAQAATATERVKKVKRVHVVPSAETNTTIREKCSRVTVDLKAVMAHYNCSRNDAIALASAAENNLLPAKR